jgi:putative oxidoreductase
VFVIRGRARLSEHEYGRERDQEGRRNRQFFQAACQRNVWRRREFVLMEKFLAAYSAQAYAAMRIVVGFLFFCHGLQKVFGLFGGVGGAAAPLSSLLGIAGVIELITGALIVVGLRAVLAAFIASGHMAAAYFIGHFPRGFWPIQNDGELAVFYCFVFLYMATRRAGIWSMDGAKNR